MTALALDLTWDFNDNDHLEVYLETDGGEVVGSITMDNQMILDALREDIQDPNLPLESLYKWLAFTQNVQRLNTQLSILLRH
jgi:hypothetical protein